MTLTTNSLSLLLLSSGLAACGWRFLISLRNQAANKELYKIGTLLCAIFFLSAGYNGTLGIGALLFSQNTIGLFFTSLIAHLLLTTLSLISIYALYYIFLPQDSSRLLITLLGLMGIIGTFLYFGSASGPLLAIITFCLLSTSLLATMYLFIQLFLKASFKSLKILSLTFAILTCISLIYALVRLSVSFRNLDVSNFSFTEWGLAFAGAAFLISSISTPVMNLATKTYLFLMGKFKLKIPNGSLRERLLSIVVTQAAQISARDIAALQVETDWKKPEWERVVTTLHAAKYANKDIVFMYIFRKKKNNPEAMEFVADADSINPYANVSGDPNNYVDVNQDGKIEPHGPDKLQWPGQDYPEALRIPEAFEAYNKPLVGNAFYTDSYGTVLTAYAPIKDEYGNTVAVLAADIKAKGAAAPERTQNPTETKSRFGFHGTLMTFAIFMTWWIAGYFVSQGNSDYFANSDWGNVYGLITIWGIWFGFRAAQRNGGFKSSLGKAISFLTIGLALQAVGQIVFSIYFEILTIDIPYPSLADIPYLASPIVYVIGLIYLGKSLKINYEFTKLNGKILASITFLFLFILSYLALGPGYTIDYNQPLTAVLDFAYPLVEAIAVSLIILIYASYKISSAPRMQKFLKLLGIAIMAQYTADLIFTYQAVREVWVTGFFGDLPYLAAYCLITLVLINLYRGITVKNNNVAETKTALETEDHKNIYVFNETLLAFSLMRSKMLNKKETYSAPIRLFSAEVSLFEK